MKRYVLFGAALILVAYVAPYVALSRAGGYELRPRGQIGMTYWRPAGLTAGVLTGESPSLSAFGYAYWPLVHTDWAFVHKPYFRC